MLILINIVSHYRASASQELQIALFEHGSIFPVCDTVRLIGGQDRRSFTIKSGTVKVRRAIILLSCDLWALGLSEYFMEVH